MSSALFSVKCAIDVSMARLALGATSYLRPDASPIILSALAMIGVELLAACLPARRLLTSVRGPVETVNVLPRTRVR
jgi:hypothetical protein